jgi:hypothetical protein
MKPLKLKSAVVVLSALVAVAPLAASADRREGDRHEVRRAVDRHEVRRVEERHWHGDIRVFHERDYAHWRAGRWHHVYHDGRWGWWWVVGGLWYFYPRAIYPYPDPYTPPVVVVQPSAPATPAPNTPPPPQFWYYCNSAKTYYPYVASCPEGWKAVPANPPVAAPK